MDELGLLYLTKPPQELPPALALVSLGFAFVVGACWGSFLNVVIARVPEGLSVVHPRSRCPRCGTQIAARDNLPVLSWVLLRGRCRSCSAPISARYPMIEAMLGLTATAVVARAGWGLESLELFTLTFLLTAIAFVDLDTWTVPNPLWVSLVLAGLAFGVAHMLEESSVEALTHRVIGAAGGGLVLGAVVIAATGIFRRTGRIGPEETAMGWGDPLILVGIGAFLGWRLLPVVVFLASLQGAVIGVIVRARGGLKGGTPVSETDDWTPPPGAVPFGPFLAIGALEAAFFGDALLSRTLASLGLGG